MQMMSESNAVLVVGALTILASIVTSWLASTSTTADSLFE